MPGRGGIISDRFVVITGVARRKTARLSAISRRQAPSLDNYAVQRLLRVFKDGVLHSLVRRRCRFFVSRSVNSLLLFVAAGIGVNIDQTRVTQMFVCAVCLCR